MLMTIEMSLFIMFVAINKLYEYIIYLCEGEKKFWH